LLNTILKGVKANKIQDKVIKW